MRIGPMRRMRLQASFGGSPARAGAAEEALPAASC